VVFAEYPLDCTGSNQLTRLDRQQQYNQSIEALKNFEILNGMFHRRPKNESEHPR
jgi:hypothetical protein